jgi:hypothetical protein
MEERNAANFVEVVVSVAIQKIDGANTARSSLRHAGGDGLYTVRRSSKRLTADRNDGDRVSFQAIKISARRCPGSEQLFAGGERYDRGAAVTGNCRLRATCNTASSWLVLEEGTDTSIDQITKRNLSR